MPAGTLLQALKVNDPLIAPLIGRQLAALRDKLAAHSETLTSLNDPLQADFSLLSFMVGKLLG